MKPKLDKARKEWLAGLKAGDSVAAVRADGLILGIGPVSISYRNNGWRLDGIGVFTPKTGKRSDSWIVPLTDELTAAYSRKKHVDTVTEKLSRIHWSAWSRFTEEQILAVDAILWPTAKT